MGWPAKPPRRTAWDVFALRDQVIGDYQRYVRSFLTIRDREIAKLVDEKLDAGFLWPDPLVQLNPSFEPGESLEKLGQAGLLHRDCLKVFCRRDDDGTSLGPLRLHRHQVDGIRAARAGESYVLTTGTGSGKSLSYIGPIVDHVLREGKRNRISAVIVYPMSALANSQLGELKNFSARPGPAARR